MLIRNLLLAQHDGNAAIVLAGPADRASSRLLGLYRSRAADRGEVQAARRRRRDRSRRRRRRGGQGRHRRGEEGCSPSGRPRSWPSVPKSATRCRIPGASIEKDFAWSPAHPVVDAYRAFKPMPYDASAPALAAVLYAVHPDDGYFKLSEPGTISGARRRAHAVHARGRRQASLSDRGPGAEGAGLSYTRPWCRRSRRHGRGVAGGSRSETESPLRIVGCRRRSPWLSGGGASDRPRRPPAPAARPAEHQPRSARGRSTPRRAPSAGARAGREASGAASTHAARPRRRRSRPRRKSLFDDTCSECHNSTELAGGLDVAQLSRGRLAHDRSRPRGS